MPPIAGTRINLAVEDPAVAGTYVVVGSMNRYSRRGGGTTTTHRAFGAERYVVSGQDDETYSISGFYRPDDVGQRIIRAAARAGTAIRIRVLPDGVTTGTGWTQLVRATTRGHDASADPTALQEASFDFTAEEDAVEVGGGALGNWLP